MYNIFNVEQGELITHINLGYREMIKLVYDYFYEMGRDSFEITFEDEVFIQDSGEELELANLSNIQLDSKIKQYLQLGFDNLFESIFNSNRFDKWYIYKVEDGYMTLLSDDQIRSILYKYLILKND